MTELELKFAALWDIYHPDIDLYHDYKFLDDRKYRGDFVHPESKVIIEIQGGIWIKGGHSTGRGIQRDCEKFCLAASRGWVVFPLTSEMITEEWIHLICKTIRSLAFETEEYN